MIVQPRFSPWRLFVVFAGLFVFCVLLSKPWASLPWVTTERAVSPLARAERSAERLPEVSNDQDPSRQAGRNSADLGMPEVPAVETAIARPDNQSSDTPLAAEPVPPAGRYLANADTPPEPLNDNHVALASNHEPAAQEDSPQPLPAIEEAVHEAAPPATPAATEPESAPATSADQSAETVHVANLPTKPIHKLPELSKPDIKELLKQKDAASPVTAPAKRQPPAAAAAKTIRYEPKSLLAALDELSNISSTGAWAKETKSLVVQIGPALAGDSKQAAQIADRLEERLRLAPALVDELTAAAQKSRLSAQRTEHWESVRKLRKAAYALERRLDVWRAAASLGADQWQHPAAVSGDPRKLSLCLATVESALPGTPQGQRWRDYLLLDALRQSAADHDAEEAEKKRQVAQWVLERIDETPMSGQQRQFINQSQVAALRTELRRWAADPVSPAALLASVERYESSGRTSDAKRVAKELQSLSISSDPVRRELASRIDAYYRNANVRVAISEKLLNRLIPPPNMEYAPVRDTVLGVPVRGQSLTSSDLAIRLIPDPDRARLALEVTGEVAASTSSTAGPATFYNDSEAVYAAQKQVEINKRGLRLMPAEVDVRHQSRLRGVTTDFEGIPLVGSIARRVAQTQHEMFSGSANDEARQKVAAKARERIDNEALDQFTRMVDRLNQNVFGPLVNLSLEPTILDAQTTAERLTMRLRVAGGDQLGSNTPRPQAPIDCLASFQIHESMINNALARLQLDGNTFTLKELALRFSDRLQRPNVWQIDPQHEDVKVTFAAKDAMMVHCRDGQLVLTLSIAELSKEPRCWNDFQVNVYFKPEIKGRSAELVSAGAVHLAGVPGVQLALRGVFSKAFPSTQRVNLMPDRFLGDANLKDLSVIQFTIDDGWIGLAIGDKAQELRTARRLGR
jgi:hypothetical protein